MVRWLVRRALAGFERQWNDDARFMHEVDGAPMAFSTPVAAGYRG